MEELAALAAEWGVEPEYVDGQGLWRKVDPDTLRRIIEIVSRGEDRPAPRRLPPVFVLRCRRDHVLAVPKLPPHAAIDWTLVADATRIASGAGLAGTWHLPEDLPVGTFGLQVDVKSGAEPGTEHARLLVAPERAFGAEEFAGGRRLWALGVQLYGLRSQRNWGHGDFTDLLGLLELAADLGAAGIGLNPLHALFADEAERASPYSPNSRLFLNPLYIDLAAVPEFPGLAATGLTQEVARLRGTAIVDYRGVAAAKLTGLRWAFQAFRERAAPHRVDDFEAFRREQGRALTRFAGFEVLRRRFGSGWRNWPVPWQAPDPSALDALRRSAPEELEFNEFVQWIADRQLGACHAKARSLGMPLGLYLDVAVGVDPRGADAWSEQATTFAEGSIGAPPDLLNTAGQNWSLVAFNPRALERHGFESFRRMLRAAMRHAGAIRLDHVLGLNRIYLIPEGAREGSYVRCPLEALLAVVAQESVAQRCLVIGEDLGTVPAHLRGTLADWGVWSYRVMLFERNDGSFRTPEDYAPNALVTFSTHDLPTFAGWCDGLDLREKSALGIDPGETNADRAGALDGLRAALARRRGKQSTRLSFLPVASYLAATPSRILLISMEDALGVAEQPNLPGTIDEHPNWRRRLPIELEALHHHPRMRALARVLHRAGRSMGPAEARRSGASHKS